ncbi:Uncharacterized protein dnl_09130 [Desulfonema limicola]|uniref:Actin-like protein N-terminal domain-containing protein n=1 Tax=Desulfonema limicola TaxID=45656 RepID=A0A975B4K3_9BACT|nr:ParM/StbA family protein [Desulfonema limicola]QTA78683.1 Uncharacterized protein dnl_09130 [Desulfonema limicola]
MSEKQIVAGIDVGYGVVKCCISNGNKIITTGFPRLLAEDESTQFEELRGLTTFQVNGHSYLIGTDALLYPEQIVRDEARDYLLRDEYWLTIGKCLFDLGFFKLTNEVRLTRLVIGVAPGHFTSEIKKQLREKALSGLTFTVAQRKFNFSAAFCNILPQGSGAYFRYILQNDGAMNNDEDYLNLYGVVDIGFRTTDFVMFEKGRFLGGMNLSEDTGVRIVLDRLREIIRKKYNYSPPIGLLTDVLKGSHLVYRGRNLDLKETVTSLLNDLINQIQNQVHQKWEDRLDRMKAILITGGGAYFIKEDFLKTFKSQILVLKTPEMSNAVGFYRYGIMEEAKRNML